MALRGEEVRVMTLILVGRIMYIEEKPAATPI